MLCEDADVLLAEFVFGVQELCSEENMTSNVYSLLHLAKSVKLCGRQVSSVTAYKRAIYNGQRLDSLDYLRCLKTDNSVV